VFGDTERIDLPGGVNGMSIPGRVTALSSVIRDGRAIQN